jgi:hypothetical protein
MPAQGLLANLWHPYHDVRRAAMLAAYVIFHVKEQVGGCGTGTNVMYLQDNTLHALSASEVDDVETLFACTRPTWNRPSCSICWGPVRRRATSSHAGCGRCAGSLVTRFAAEQLWLASETVCRGWERLEAVWGPSPGVAFATPRVPVKVQQRRKLHHVLAGCCGSSRLLMSAG